jgi:hypothetical protein
MSRFYDKLKFIAAYLFFYLFIHSFKYADSIYKSTRYYTGLHIHWAESYYDYSQYLLQDILFMIYEYLSLINNRILVRH